VHTKVENIVDRGNGKGEGQYDAGIKQGERNVTRVQRWPTYFKRMRAYNPRGCNVHTEAENISHGRKGKGVGHTNASKKQGERELEGM
jgi:hypothetical protein